MRRYLKPTIVLVLMGLLFGCLFRYIHDPADEASLANYLRSAVHGAAITLAGWSVHLYFTSRSSVWVRQWPLIAELIVRSLVMAIAVATVAIVLEPILYPHGIDRHWLVGDYPKIIGLAFTLSTLIGAFYELIRLVGGRVLLNVLLGRYRRPRREQRVLLFLDLVGSTSLAEQMGELRVQELLTRFFSDIDEAIISYGGEVHAYVGDEVIVTWPIGSKKESRALECFFAIRERMAAQADHYRREFGLVPEFRAGLHAGPVAISECGDSRRQVAFFGDSMNVAARLQALCKDAGHALLVSGDLLRLLHPGQDLVIDALGPTQLRGRVAPIEVFAIERRAKPQR
jgi:class 3 adenylate cyclase